jgi:heat shock protein HtpX
MVTMTLVQGVVNAFVMFFARIIAFFASSFVKEDMQYIVRFIVTIVLEIAFSFLGMFVVAFFSRYREFRADAGGAKLAGRANMIHALQALQRTLEIRDENSPESMATLKISGHGSGLMALLSTHPPLETRIKRLQGTV